MKQLIFAFIILLIVSGCKKDDPAPVLTVPHENVDLEVGMTYQVIATGGESFIYQSKDDFVATINNAGIISAKHVGRVEITVSSTAGTVSIYVKVNPKISLYDEPFTNWNLTRSEILTQLGAPDMEDGNSIAYLSSNPAVFLYMYTFNALSKLTGSAVAVKSEYVYILSDFIDERYQYYDSSEGVMMFINSTDREDATVVVGITVVDSNTILVGYIPNSGSKFKIQDITEFIKEYRSKNFILDPF